MKDKLELIEKLQNEIDHLMEFWDEEDDKVIWEKTRELIKLQLEISVELQNTTYH